MKTDPKDYQRFDDGTLVIPVILMLIPFVISVWRWLWG